MTKIKHNIKLSSKKCKALFFNSEWKKNVRKNSTQINFDHSPYGKAVKNSVICFFDKKTKKAINSSSIFNLISKLN